MANEKRLIDYDKMYLSVMDAALSSCDDDTIFDIMDASVVDAAEVVRCEKCNHAVWDEEYEMWKCVEDAEYDEESGVWFGYSEYHNGDFFCADGERKDGDGNG